MKKAGIILLICVALIALVVVIAQNREKPFEDNDPVSFSDKDPIYPSEDPAPTGETPDESGWSEPSDTEEPVYETPDPDAFLSRNWEDHMQMPSEEQIESVRGIARSPYIAVYHHFPGVDRALEYCVDLHADHQPRGTYLCPFNWWMDVSALKARYASVYNDYTGTPGGYCGFQTLDDGSRVFIMTVWSTFCEDYDGNVTVFTPEVIYPEGQGRGNTNLNEGSFTHCIVPFDWHAGRDYRVLVQQSQSETTGNVVLTAYVCDLLKNEWNMLVSIDTGVADVYMNSVGGFLENFLTEYAGEVRTMELFNLRARSADTYQWVSADSARFLLNGSISDLGYIGSAAFGTDGSSIWAITSGVSGLCQTPSVAETYPLAPGDSEEPY